MGLISGWVLLDVSADDDPSAEDSPPLDIVASTQKTKGKTPTSNSPG